jgi:hypothetical protein
MAASCTFIKRASFILWMPVFLYRKSNKQLNVLRFCCAQVVTLLRVADISGLCIEGLVFSDTRSEFMQNELTAMQTRNTLLRAQSAECGFSSVAKNKITVMDDRRNEQG